jgi:hypothetical protein
MSQSERKSDEIRETYERVTARDGHMCYVCGERPGNQLAHVLPQWAKRYWSEQVIHHPLNLRWVCSLRCNKLVEISPKSRPVEAEAYAKQILDAIEGKGETRC